MKTIIAGSRDLGAYSDHEKVFLVADAVMKSGWRDLITEVVSGGARGIDIAGETWAAASKPPIPIKQFIPDWRIGRFAGIQRNRMMAEYADALILIWNGTSKGSANMKKEARNKNLKIYEYIVK